MDTIIISRYAIEHPTIKGFREECLVALFDQGLEIWQTGIFRLYVSPQRPPDDWQRKMLE